MGTQTVAGITGATESLSSLVYTSRAMVPFDAHGLDALVRDAQRRNRSEKITGLVVFDRGRFLQWLEGPPEGVDRIAASIRRDPRHNEIRIVAERPVGRRIFTDWDMRLALREGGMDAPPQGAFTPASEVLDCLMERPEAAPALLPKLAPLRTMALDRGRAGAANGALDPEAVRRFVERAVFPRLAEIWRPGLRPEWRFRVTDKRAAELARSLIAPAGTTDPAEAGLGHGRSLGALVMLLERCAAALGDLWHRGACGDAELTLALARMQMILRRALSERPAAEPAGGLPGQVVVAHMPGDPHFIGALMKAEILRQHGWAVETLLPGDGAGLAASLASREPDAVILSTSRVVRRRQALAEIAAQVARIRRVLARPGIPVIVGGRTFRDIDGAWKAVGADGCCRSIAGAAEAVSTALRRAGVEATR